VKPLRVWRPDLTSSALHLFEAPAGRGLVADRPGRSWPTRSPR